MPVHQTIDPVEATAKSLDALLTALDGSPSAGAQAAFKAAIRRHGQNLLDTAGPEALAAALSRIRADAADKAHADERERIVLAAWAGITGEKDRAA